MRTILRRAVWVAGILTAAALTPTASAQLPGRPPFGPRPVIVRVPVVTTLRLQTTVTVPDRGTAFLGGYSRLSEGRSEYGAPVLGKVPYAGRGVRNVGYGREVLSTRATASVRIIDLREEEYRQTGVRSR